MKIIGANVTGSFILNSQDVTTTIQTSNVWSGSVATDIIALNASTASLNRATASLNATTASLNAATSSLLSYTASNNAAIADILLETASLNLFSASLLSYTASNNAAISDILLETASFNAFSSSILNHTASTNAAISDILLETASINLLTASLLNYTASQNALNGTYATTGSNTFFGTQTITGSLFISNNLVVQGTSSVQNITASAVSIGTNTVILNTDTPAVRFGGIKVQDSGSGAGASGSLFWDSLNNHWIYQHPTGGAESGMSARLISGPKNSGSLGNEAGITSGKITVAVGDDHIGDSIMTQTGTVISVAGDLTATSLTGSINGSQITNSTVANAKLANSTISGIALGSNLATLTIGTGLSGTSYNGSTGVTIANTGVTSITAGTGISRDVSTGGVTITNTGVTSNVAGTGVTVSGATGAVTISIGQSVATSATPTFGKIFLTTNLATGIANNSFNTSKAILGNIHMQNGDGTSGDNKQAAITFQGGSSSEAQAGIYVSNNSSSGTAMGFATTDSYATGPQLFMTATNTGLVNFPRVVPTYAGTSLVYNSGTWAISTTGNAATATAAAGATFQTQNNATWGAKIQLGGNGDPGSNSGLAVVQATDGNLHLDCGTGKTTYINYYRNGIIYLNGATYYISSNGSQYNGNAATVTNGVYTNANNTLTGNLNITGGQGSASTAAYTSFSTLTFDDSYSNVARGPNKIITYGRGTSWVGGIGIHDATQAYYAGDTHKFYKFDGTTATLNLSLDGSGNLVATGNVTAYSDARVKENINPINNALLKVLELTGVTYNRIDLEDKSTQIGFIAQEVEKVVPEVINYDDETDRYSVSYGNVTALLVEAIKEQQTQIEELKSIINGLTK